MKRELELWKFTAERLERKQGVMLLVVGESAGSSPGRQGFKMAVAEDDLLGSIGGGVMEVRLVEQAKSRIRNSKSVIDSEIIEQNHKKRTPNPSGMICSGRQTVIFFKLGFRHLKAVRQIISALKNYHPKVLRITPSDFQVLQNQAGDFDFRFERKNDNDFLYEEKIGFKNRLFIIGGGHCALALSELISKMDFYISLFDDRPALNTLAKNRFVHEKRLIESYERIGDFIASGRNHYVVVMTLGYRSDEIVIGKLLDKDFKYFGVLGSKAKMGTLLKDLRKDGFDAEKLNRIRTPAGIEINSRTPEEIAVSIAAEIIAVKNS